VSAIDHAGPDRTMARVSGPLVRYTRELSVAAAYVLLLLILAVRAPRFFAGSEFGDILVASAPVLVTAVGMSLVILCRQIDISVGAQLAVCCIAAGRMSQEGWPMPAVALGTVAVGIALGAVNGLLVAMLNIPSIVATLATLVILREGRRLLNRGEMIKDLRPEFQWFGLSQSGGQWMIVVIAAAVFVAFAWAMRYLAAGRAVYAVGADYEAARLAGVRPRRVTFAVFAVMGALVGVAALLTAVRLPHIDPKTGEGGFELQVIAAVVVGGVAISGGRGTLIGTLIGVALLGTIRSALVFLGASAEAHWVPYWEKAIQGAIILVAVASDAFYRRSR
jgi:rhamnose transport system permease protein